MDATAATGNAAEQLEELLARRRTLSERLDQVEAGQREAGAAWQEAQDALVALERTGTATDRQLADAKKKLQAADAKRRDEAYGERQRGLRLAIGDVDAATAAHVSGNLAELLADVEAKAREAAAAVDRAAREVVVATDGRAAVDQWIHRLLALGGTRVDPGTVVRARSDPLRREASDFLLEGGEAAPVIDRVRAQLSPGPLRDAVAELDGTGVAVDEPEPVVA